MGVVGLSAACRGRRRGAMNGRLGDLEKDDGGVGEDGGMGCGRGETNICWETKGNEDARINGEPPELGFGGVAGAESAREDSWGVIDMDGREGERESCTSGEEAAGASC